jgi:hypothetical protein
MQLNKCKRHNRWLVVVLLIASLQLSALVLTGCTQPIPEVAAGEGAPAKVEHLEGGADASRITLTEEAARRLDIQTAPVTEAQGAESGKKGKVIPYAAVLYDTTGKTWTYTKNADSLTFVRSPITVDHIEGDQAVITDGPAVGAVVVTVGATELYGSESEFEEE